MCPNSKEKLSIIKKDELLEFFKDRTIDLPQENIFLINESKSFLYRVSPYGFVKLLPEEAIPLEKTMNSIPAFSGKQQTISFSTLKKHKANLEVVYGKDNYVLHPAGRTPERSIYESRKVHKPLADNLNPGSVLDVGCGIGFFRRFTRGKFHLMVDVSEINLSNNFAPYKANGRSESIPVLDGSFDNVVSLRSLEHCQDPQTSLGELVRCAKPGGRILISCWREDWPACLSHSVWAYTNLVYFLAKAKILLKKNPKLFLDRALYKLKLKKSKSLERAVFWDKDTAQIYSRRYNRDAFEKMIEKTGAKVIKKGYCGVETPYLDVPVFLLDRFFDSEKYGLFFYFICQKPNNIKIENILH